MFGETHNITLMALLNVYGQILLGKKGESWILLGGHLEFSDQGRAKAVVREILEESQLEGVFDQRWIFGFHEHRNGQLYLFDVFVGSHYGQKTPTPLLEERISEIRWFDFDETKKLALTYAAQRAINFLENKDRSFMSECLHHFQIVMNLAQSRGGSEQTMSALKSYFDKSAKLLSLINRETMFPDTKIEKNEMETVLFIDDHHEVLTMFSENFRKLGYRVFAFSDPRETLKWLKELKDSEVEINALVVDYQMPGINGNELIEKAKPFLNADTQIILISGENIPDKEKEGVQFFRKPVSLMELIWTIQKKEEAVL